MFRLLEAPAPDLEAMAVKIGLIARHRALELDGGEECLGWLEADARRLAARPEDTKIQCELAASGSRRLHRV